MYYFSICAIARDETDYLNEWLCSNLAVGTEHFFIYDNNSKIPAKQTLKKYIDKNIATVIDFPGTSAQMPAYTNCIYNFGKKSKWIGFIDCDEILIPKQKNSVQEVLQDYEEFGGFNVSWRIYGSGGHKTKPNGLMIENYIYAMPKDHYENSHTKGLIRPDRTLRAGSNPHHFVYKPGYFAVSEDFKKVPNAWTPHCSDKLQLNHYFLKSEDEFKTKIQRPRADAVHLPGRKLEDFYKFDALCTEKDECALRFVDKAKEIYHQS